MRRLTTQVDITDVSPDGKHFLLLKDVEAFGAAKAGFSEIRIVLHFFDELNRVGGTEHVE